MTENVLAQSSKRFIGDNRTKKVHDSSQKTCTIDPEAAEGFDNLDIAHAAGYENCPICLSRVFINPINYVAIPRAQGTTMATKETSCKINNKMFSGPPEKK